MSSMSGMKSFCSSRNSLIQKYPLPLSTRYLSWRDLTFDETDVLGKGSFGKCSRGKLGHLDVCIQAFKKYLFAKTLFKLKQYY